MALQAERHHQGDHHGCAGDPEAHLQESLHAEGFKQVSRSSCRQCKARNHHDPDQGGSARPSAGIDPLGQQCQKRGPAGAHAEADQPKPEEEAGVAPCRIGLHLEGGPGRQEPPSASVSMPPRMKGVQRPA